MFVRFVTILLLCVIFFTGCKARKSAVRHKKQYENERTVRAPKPVIERKKAPAKTTVVESAPVNMPYSQRVTNYINDYSEISKEEMHQYGIPASITLAQGILESGAGAGELTRKGNNHFGIKCHDWTGERVFHDDDSAQECFRKYSDPKYSYRDHSLFLTQRSRYRDLFTLRKDDYKGWSHGLRKAGYATDPKYPQKLIGIIERYDLTRFDDEVLGKKSPIRNTAVANINTYEVRAGDTLYSIARSNNLSVETLKEYNGLSGNEISVGQILYLHSVKN